MMTGRPDRHASEVAAEESTPAGLRAEFNALGFPIRARSDFSDVTFLLEVDHPVMARAARPGQFVIVMVNDHGERIPLTIADFDRDKGTITMVIQAFGKTTREMRDFYKAGDSFLDFVGPLG